MKTYNGLMDVRTFLSEYHTDFNNNKELSLAMFDVYIKNNVNPVEPKPFIEKWEYIDTIDNTDIQTKTVII